MNYREVFLLVSASQGLLLSLALISSVLLRKYSNFLLGLITLVVSLEILTAWAIQVGYVNQSGRFPFWVLGSYFILPPAVFLFAKLNTNPQFRIKKWHWLIFAPALIEILLEASKELVNQAFGANYQLSQHAFWFVYTEILPLAAMVIVLIIFGRDIYLLRIRMKQHAITLPASQLVKVWLFFALFALITILWILESVLHLPVFRITTAILCAFLYLLGYIAFFKPDFFDLPAYLTKTTSANYDDEVALQQLRDIFERDKIFLQPKLTLKETAQQLDLPTRYLSELINKYHNVNFKTFVNTFRVEEVIRKVEAGELGAKTLLGIALESGFNSKSAFNQTFKELKGQSPSVFFK